MGLWKNLSPISRIYYIKSPRLTRISLTAVFSASQKTALSGDFLYYTVQNEICMVLNKTLLKQQINLQEEIVKLNIDQEYIEKIAREKFMMVKPGEKVFRVIESKQMK